MSKNFESSELKNPNPEEEQEEIKVEVGENDKIEDVAQKMTKSWKPKAFVSSVFDGVELIAGGGTTPDEIIEQYTEAKAKKKEK